MIYNRTNNRNTPVKPHEDRPYCIVNPLTNNPIGGVIVFAQDRFMGAMKLRNRYMNDLSYKACVDTTYSMISGFATNTFRVGRILTFEVDFSHLMDIDNE